MIKIMFDGFGDIMMEVLIALAPITLLFFVFQIFVLKLPKNRVIKILKGILMTFLGMSLFLQGVHVSYLPLGEKLGMAMGSMANNWIMIPIGLLLGFAATYAEPAVRVMNNEVENVSGGYINKKIMLYTTCIGVAISVALSMIKVIMGVSLWYFIVPGYILAFVLSRYVSPTFVAIAFDSGGVATGPMTVTLLLSMTVGVAKVLENRDPLLDGFGMVSLVALTPILSVLILGFLYARKEKVNESE
ncbi:uncharacterized protein DUF1538 [Anaerobacterium chartisolvens]|uniref:Uncharacterized protein DUF1538 n=1 Tax=Anaerobacterium chartisolvens TaxID=1297424 RepID=A0A369ANS9_9FIRM|nr:DUF1538 domain-containing protein [Anaerobacterium chartisolvens]RCX09988.1 uncharacterized protein DUF1538 [Anaerobacterium chartisolvens]